MPVLISSGAAIPFTAHATSPTITMPRVKAITTGSIPSFLDAILNFAESDTTSTLAHQDTWLAQMQAKKNGKLVMYGDDTWLKLFPTTFTRADGTSSFFVSDFSEVDNNVTRHIPNELENDDWNTMILHYLGLDHIGHKAGPRSPHMVPKQKEMDRVVQQIYKKIESEAHLQSTLFVLCGDHGMNDAGNHGGSSAGETSPALVFVSPKFKQISNGVPCPIETEEEFRFYNTVEQSDLAPTLAGLLGFPVPRNNLGVFIPHFLHFWKDSDKLQLIYGNARQILNVIKATFANSLFEANTPTEDCSLAASSVNELACLWARAEGHLIECDDTVDGCREQAITRLIEFSKRSQEVMSNTASNYNISRLNFGMILATAAVIAASVASLSCLRKLTLAEAAYLAVSLSYGGMMFASSFVEEEQHFWYWSTSGWLACLYFTKSRARGLQKAPGLLPAGSLVVLRVIRRWNQTGQKFAGAPDITKSFFPSHRLILWGVVLTTYFDVVRRISRRGFRYASIELSSIIAITLCLAAFIFKVSFTNADAPELLEGFSQTLLKGLESIPLVMQVRAVFLGIGGVVAYVLFFETKFGSVRKRKEKDSRVWIYHDLLTLFLATQSRVTNVPLFLFFELQFQIIDSLEFSLTELTLTSLLFQYLSFFAFGGSNAISSIDLSNAYNGITNYNIIAVGILTFMSNWAGPIWWTSATSLLLHLCINVIGGNILFWLAAGRYKGDKQH
ncbi:hypothetical protein FGG08_004677 [Glutinoglossum americanum]|uniref:GPI ethanolamine phosphate transferase 2 n=1 Tax=Glutinoglossum americanum TaxID=1670608 RepID=A0A9P8KWS7_9PEZI|nr:hypothetical protein FGG08_004677 [Glutinoglossum americanum]